jgi:hypothetical protein
MGSDFDRAVGLAGGGTADEDGHAFFAVAGFFGFFGDVDHFVQGGRDEAGKAERVVVVGRRAAVGVVLEGDGLCHLELAIGEGATIVRVGTALFGERES